MKKRRKLKKWVRIIPVFVILILLIPSVYAFYFSKYESSIISKFIFNNNLADSYVRATVVTYWIDTNECLDNNDLTTCNISGKASWNLKDAVVNSNWILLDDGYYYYKTSINSRDITKDNIKTSDIALIDKELSFTELSDELLAGTEVIPQYEIVYEFIQSDSVETSWKVSYEGNIPEIIQ